CGLFLAVGMGGSTNAMLALMIGAIVCIAISQAGTCSQDLKTGFLVGATPVRQQGALVIGVLASVLAVGWTAYVLNLSETREVRLTVSVPVRPELIAGKSSVTSRLEQEEKQKDSNAPAPKEYLFVKLEQGDLPTGQGLEPGNYLVDSTTQKAVYARHDGVGSARLNAPQARLMATVIDGILTQKLPWDLILIGVAISLFIELMGFRALTFAVGVYLPLSSTMPVFLGGLVRKIADRRYGREPDAEEEPEGTLWCSGLIAGASILGILAAMQSFVPGFDKGAGLLPALAFLRDLPFAAVGGASSPLSDVFGLGMLVLLGYLMLRGARPPGSRPPGAPEPPA
ncbi:MAG TPA: OPT/YSL family transporter, partial [Planctomycetota bacterium]|nr:OPT/YSL family transporter [Planctomycetota bacterium]